MRSAAPGRRWRTAISPAATLQRTSAWGALAPRTDSRSAARACRRGGGTAGAARLPAGALPATRSPHRLFARVVLAAVGWAAFKAFPAMRTLAVGIAALL